MFVPNNQAGPLVTQFIERGMDKSGIRLISSGDLTPDDDLPNMTDAMLGLLLHITIRRFTILRFTILRLTRLMSMDSVRLMADARLFIQLLAMMPCTSSTRHWGKPAVPPTEMPSWPR